MPTSCRRSCLRVRYVAAKARVYVCAVPPSRSCMAPLRACDVRYRARLHSLVAMFRPR